MNSVDLYYRLARKLETRRGGVVLSQADLDILLASGAYEAICAAATADLKRKRGIKTEDVSVNEVL